MNRLRYPTEIERAAELDAQLQVDALLTRMGRRSTDFQIDHFEQLRADCGRFWLLVMAVSPVISGLIVWFGLLAIGLLWHTHAVQAVVLAIRNQP